MRSSADKVDTVEIRDEDDDDDDGIVVDDSVGAVAAAAVFVEDITSSSELRLSSSSSSDDGRRLRALDKIAAFVEADDAGVVVIIALDVAADEVGNVTTPAPPPSAATELPSTKEERMM